MLARLRKSTDEKDQGFTLIELLVVIIIIGILAAIAIPTFLKQREKGYKAAVKSDLKNASTAEESWATDHDGAYTATLANLVTEGFNPTGTTATGVTTVPTTNVATDCFILTGTHAKLSGVTFYYSSKTGVLTEGGTAPTCP